MMDKLKPCYCGSKAKTRQNGLWFVVCTGCGDEEGPHAYQREATKIWNTRHNSNKGEI